MGLTLIIICFIVLFKINKYQYVQSVKNNISESRSNPVVKHAIDNQTWKAELLEFDLKSETRCDGDCLWLPNSFCDHLTRSCVCNKSFVRIEKKCLAKISLGEVCSNSKQCQTLNTECVLNKCNCKYGYKVFDNRCIFSTRDDNPKSNTLLIILCVIFSVILSAAITVAIIFFKKKLSNMISGRAQNNIVYRPSENNEFNTRGISVYPEITGFDYSNPTIETTLEILDKPPSYEEIMTLSKSMNNILHYQVSSDQPCPSYSVAIRNMRVRSSSM
ncbi:uncharacterized protein LOC111615676 isoform X1 [Centruroides sculpturatus]|uniref:uncharacterized protein LOC111615676 isoform X1 n=1 Tax=Centruroides sculpturatus TaxID=218467 RepID=UPI000C6E17CA|nr:uncharacterized protein LOC111615676 isoform X1 [Centruroides sculpturatus]